MNQLCKTLSLVLVFLATNVNANDTLAVAVKVAKQKIENREARIKSNVQKLTSLKMDKVQFDHKKPVVANFGNETLTCTQGFFPWFDKDPALEYKDCEYKLNVGDPKDINKLYATLQMMKKQGWKIVKSEVVKQDILSESSIKNVERYRYSRHKLGN